MKTTQDYFYISGQNLAVREAVGVLLGIIPKILAFKPAGMLFA